MASQDDSLPRTAPKVRAVSSGNRVARRIVTFLLGCWLSGIVLVALLAPVAFRSVDRVMMDQPMVQMKAVEAIGPVATHQLLRHLAAEVNGGMFSLWGWIQLGLAVFVFGLLLFGSRAGKQALGASGFMILLSGAMAFYVIPRIIDLSRAAAIRGIRPAVSSREFDLLHAAFSSFELVVVFLGTVLLWLLFRRNRAGFGVD